MFSEGIEKQHIGKPKDFLMFSGGIEKQHRAIMGQKKISEQMCSCNFSEVF